MFPPCPNYQIHGSLFIHADLLAQRLFINLVGSQQPFLNLFGQMPNALDNIPASTVIRRNMQRKTGIIFRQRFCFTNPFLQT